MGLESTRTSTSQPICRCCSRARLRLRPLAVLPHFVSDIQGGTWRGARPHCLRLLGAQESLMQSDPRSHGLWERTAPPPPATTVLDYSATADVVVVGAGYTGLSAALHLAEAGHKRGRGRRQGTLHCAVGEAGLKEIEQRAAQDRRRGAPVELLDTAQTASRVGGG